MVARLRLAYAARSRRLRRRSVILICDYIPRTPTREKSEARRPETLARRQNETPRGAARGRRAACPRSSEDFEQIVEALGRDRPPFVHIICHGNHDDDGRPYLLLTPRSKKGNQIYLDTSETHNAFRQCFGGQSVLFSACLVAKYERHIDSFRRSARLRHVAA